MGKRLVFACPNIHCAMMRALAMDNRIQTVDANITHNGNAGRSLKESRWKHSASWNHNCDIKQLDGQLFSAQRAMERRENKKWIEMPSGRTLCVHGIPISLATNYMKIQFDGIRWICCFIEFLPKYCAKKTLESLEICHIEHSNDKWNQNPINEFVRKCCELIVLIFSLHYSNILCSFDGFSSISSSSFYARYAVAYSSNHNSTFCCIHCHIYICCALCR